jgi:hypothetical protein
MPPLTIKQFKNESQFVSHLYRKIIATTYFFFGIVVFFNISYCNTFYDGKNFLTEMNLKQQCVGAVGCVTQHGHL